MGKGWGGRRRTLFVRAYTSSTVFGNPDFLRMNDVMSTGLVEPGLFFNPLRLTLTSSWLTFSSAWVGNAISTGFQAESYDSAAQKTKALIFWSFVILDAVSSSKLMVSLAVSLVCSLAFSSCNVLICFCMVKNGELLKVTRAANSQSNMVRGADLK